MIRPDFRDYKNSGNELMHSAKGTTWGKHKYVAKKIVNGKVRYVYRTLKNAASLATRATSAAGIVEADKKKREATTKLNDALLNLKTAYTAVQETSATYGPKSKQYLVAYAKYTKVVKEYEAAKAAYDKLNTNK